MEHKIINGLIYGADDWVGSWVNEKCGGDFVTPNGAFSAIGALNGSDLVAGVSFFNQNNNDIYCAFAVTNAAVLTRGRLTDAFEYPFHELGLNHVSAEVLSTNQKCIKLVSSIGFRLEGKKREAGPAGEDVFIFGLLKAEFEARFLKHEIAVTPESP